LIFLRLENLRILRHGQAAINNYVSDEYSLYLNVFKLIHFIQKSLFNPLPPGTIGSKLFNIFLKTRFKSSENKYDIQKYGVLIFQF